MRSKKSRITAMYSCHSFGHGRECLVAGERINLSARHGSPALQILCAPTFPRGYFPALSMLLYKACVARRFRKCDDSSILFLVECSIVAVDHHTSLCARTSDDDQYSAEFQFWFLTFREIADVVCPAVSHWLDGWQCSPLVLYAPTSNDEKRRADLV